jgi:hypothetical protein
LPFALAEPATAATNAFLAVMLTDTNLAQAEATLQRGAASDSSFPPQTVVSGENLGHRAQRAVSFV